MEQEVLHGNKISSRLAPKYKQIWELTQALVMQPTYLYKVSPTNYLPTLPFISSTQSPHGFCFNVNSFNYTSFYCCFILFSVTTIQSHFSSTALRPPTRSAQGEAGHSRCRNCTFLRNGAAGIALPGQTIPPTRPGFQH